MIEPLRLSSETNHPLQISKILYCEGCVIVKARKNNPNVAIKICDECVRQYLCQECDEVAHRAHDCRHHQRRTLVLGPGIRKRILKRGDAVTFPYSLDEVKVKLKSRVYYKGQIIHREPNTHAKFRVGLSGISVHVQILGARNLLISDINNTSDPFVTAVYSGTKLGSTRVRPRDLNPQWDNETFVVPMDDNFPDPKNMQRSQRHLFKLEVYDYDWFSFNDFLGHVEIPRKKLYKMALAGKEKPICLPLTIREFHGIVGVNLGFDNKELYLKVVRAESLDKIHPFGLDNPYAKVYFGDKLLGSTPVQWNTLDPSWLHSNVFRVKINDVLARERDILMFIKEKAASLVQSAPTAGENGIQYAGSSVVEGSSSSAAPPVASQSHGPSASLTMDRSLQSGSVSNGSHAVSNASHSLDMHQHDPKKVVEQLPTAKPKEIHEMVSLNMLDDNQLLFRVELYDFNTYLSHTHLGTARIGVQYLRKLLPGFPKTAVAEPDTVVAQISRRFGLESSRGTSSRSLRGLKSIRQRNSVSVRSAGTGGDGSQSQRSDEEAKSSRKTTFRLSGIFGSNKMNSMRINSTELSGRLGGSSSRMSSVKQSASVESPAIGGNQQSNDAGEADTVENQNQDSVVNRQSLELAGENNVSSRFFPSKLKSEKSSQFGRQQTGDTAEAGTFSKQASSFFGRLMSARNMNDDEDDVEEDEDEGAHEELLEEIYGQQQADEEHHDDVLLNVEKRIIDAPGLSISQNYQPTERKRIGGKVLKVAAYQDMMARKQAAREKRPHHVHGSHNIGKIAVDTQGSQEGLNLQIAAAGGGTGIVGGGSGSTGRGNNLAEGNAEPDSAVKGPSTGVSFRSRAVTFEDSVDLNKDSLKIGEIGFDNDSLVEGSERGENYYVMNQNEFQPSADLNLDINAGEAGLQDETFDQLDQLDQLEQSGEGEYTEDVDGEQFDESVEYDEHNNNNEDNFNSELQEDRYDDDRLGDANSFQSGLGGSHGLDGLSEELDEYQDGEINPHMASAENSVASLRSKQSQNSHPSYQSNFSQYSKKGKHRKESQRSYASDHDQSRQTPQSHPSQESARSGAGHDSCRSQESHASDGGEGDNTNAEASLHSSHSHIHSSVSQQSSNVEPEDGQVVENDLRLETYFPADNRPHDHKAHQGHVHQDAHAGTVFAPEGLVPIGFEDDQKPVIMKEVDSGDELSVSSGDISADDMDREENIHLHKDGKALHINRDAIYADEEGDEFRPLITVDRTSDGKLRSRNTFMNIFHRLSGRKANNEENDPAETQGDNYDEGDSDEKDVRVGFGEGDLGYVRSLIQRSSRYVSSRVSQFMGRSKKEEVEVDDEEAERQARIRALGENPVVWSPLRHFHVEQMTPKNVAQPTEKNRGFLVVRLIPSTRGEVIIGLDEAARHMSLGETASIKCRYDYAYGNFCLGGSIPPRANIIFTMELQEINGVGRYSQGYRQVLRCYRFSRRWYRRFKRRYDAFAAYMRINRPLLKCIAPILLRLFGWDLFPQTEEETVSENPDDGDNQEFQDEQEEIDDEDDGGSSDSEEGPGDKVKVDKHMKKHIDGGVVAGVNYLWNFDPKARKKLKARLKEQARQRRIEQLQQQRRRENAMLTRIAEQGGHDEDDADAGATTTGGADSTTRRSSVMSSSRSRPSNDDDRSVGSASQSDAGEGSQNGSDSESATKSKRRRSTRRRSSNISAKSAASASGSKASKGSRSRRDSNSVGGGSP